ncbi:uncharacterized protein LOC120207894 [Hibiscus syriacus]|uniref:uncharacterized protein LOC120207894 n=1 Tax=Hibiscus syriacus TaxID=106335 RepID=UPI001924D9C7|nr:uncharacterized protein LOC120207894 [Hibiscus syriacus]
MSFYSLRGPFTIRFFCGSIQRLKSISQRLLTIVQRGVPISVMTEAEGGLGRGTWMLWGTESGCVVAGDVPVNTLGARGIVCASDARPNRQLGFDLSRWRLVHYLLEFGAFRSLTDPTVESQLRNDPI